MKPFRHTFLLLVALASCGIANAQTTHLQPFCEFEAGVTRFRTASLPTLGATVGLRDADFTVGLRYRHATSPLREAEVSHEVSLLFQHSIRLAPRLELFGGVATGFAVQHSRLLYDKPLSDGKTLALNAEVDLGLRYYVSDHVALTLSVGAGCHLTAQDWRSLSRQLPYDPRTVPTFVTVTGGLSIGFAPRRDRLRLPRQLVVAGDAPILAEYD